MVIIHIKPSFVDALKGKYTKDLWSKMKTLYTAMEKANPLVTHYSYIFIPFSIISPIILYFGHRNEEYIPKYYEFIYIVRPDDPKVQRIRKDDGIRVQQAFMVDSMHMPAGGTNKESSLVRRLCAASPRGCLDEWFAYPASGEETEFEGKEQPRHSEDLNRSLTAIAVHVSNLAPKFFTLQSSAYVPELEACGRLVCCAQRLCRSGSAPEETEQRINRGRRGAQAGPELEGPSGSEDGILPIPVSPSPASTSSQEDACKPPPRNCYRLVMLGSARVGKTAIVARFLSNKFEESYTPTIEDFHRKLYRIKGEVHQLDLLDTSGNHPFPAMRRLSFLTGDLFVVVFSLDCRESFEEAIRLRESILETKVSATQSATKSRSKSHFNLKVPMVIVGNKCDKETKTVTVEEAEEYCNSQDDCCVFVEASAKRNYHVEELFYQLFVVAGLPLEMAPNHHRKVPLTFGSPTMLPPSQPRHKATLSIKRRLSDACGVVAPNVRRPSIRTDLMIMRTKTCSLAAGNENNAPGSRITLRTTDARKTCTIQ